MPGDIPNSPALALVVVAPNGKIYKLEANTWSDPNNVISEPKQTGVVNELTQFGVYLASIPDDFAAGIGIECVVVNMKSIVPSSTAKSLHKSTDKS